MSEAVISRRIELPAAVAENPWIEEPIPVCDGLPGFKQFISERVPAGMPVMPYIGGKTEEEWRGSTSPRFMNSLGLPYVYVPVHIEEGDQEGFERLLVAVHDELPEAIGINFTHPWKSKKAARLVFANGGGPAMFDSVVRDEEGGFVLQDNNGPGFKAWYASTGRNLKNRSVVIIGGGGAGSAIAETLASSTNEVPEQPARITIIDPIDKKNLADNLRLLVRDSTYISSLEELTIERLSNKTLVINAAGAYGIESENGLGLRELLYFLRTSNAIFVDIRANHGLTIVQEAEAMGVTSFDGAGMSLFSNRNLVANVARSLKRQVPSLEAFRREVERASTQLAGIAA